MIDRSDARVNYTEDDVGEEGECADCHDGVSIDDGCEPENPLLCHACEKGRLAKALASLESALRALVESLPKCDACDAPATKAFQRGGDRWCDEHGKGSGPYPLPERPVTDYPRAEPLRVAARLLKGEK
jgi:hypothetical protein